MILVEQAKKHKPFWGLILTIVMVCIFEFLNAHGVGISPIPGLFAAVILCTYSAGLAQGLTSAIIGILYGVWWFSDPHSLVTYQPENLLRLLVLSVSLVIASILVASCKFVSDQFYLVANAKASRITNAILEQKTKSSKPEIENAKGSFQSELEEALVFAQKDRSWVGVVIVEIGGLEPIDLTYGSDVAEEIQNTIYRRLLNSSRRNDIVERIDSNKFILCLVGVRLESAIAESGRRILTSLEQPILLANIIDELSISANAGISIFPADSNTALSLIEQAEKALEQAKSREESSQVVLWGADRIKPTDLAH